MSSALDIAPKNRVAGGTTRKSQPFFNPSALGGYSVVPRRGVANATTVATKEGLQRMATGSPLRLLSLLADLDPSLGLATWNALRLTTAPEAVKIVAMKESKPGAGDDQVDDGMTAAIDDLWKSLPNEIGGLNSLLGMLLLSALFTGMACLEVVPGPRSTGLDEVIPVDSLTISFRRVLEGKKYVLKPLQWQLQPRERTVLGNNVELNTNTFFWRAVDPVIDDPYGRAPFAPALGQILADLALIQDLRDAIHNSAWPRLGIGFDFTEMYRVAVEIMKIQDPVKAAAWVQEQFEEAKAAVASLKPDDNVLYDATGEADLKTIEGGKGLDALKEILVFLRQRVVQSVKSLPTLMGINDGSTQTYTSIEWQIFATGLESLRDICVQLLVQVADTHLRLLGSPLKAAATVQRIRTNDQLIDARAESMRIKNAKEKRKQGWITNEQAAIEITGSGPVGDPDDSEEDEEDVDDDPKDEEKEPKSIVIPGPPPVIGQAA